MIIKLCLFSDEQKKAIHCSLFNITGAHLSITTMKNLILIAGKAQRKI